MGLLIAFLVLYGCERFWPGVAGSGNVVNQERTVVAAFDGVLLNGSPTVAVTINPQATGVKVLVRTDDNLQEYVSTAVSDGSLVIETTETVAPTDGIRVEIVTPSLSRVRLNGSGDINVQGIGGERFDARVYGSGDIHLSGQSEASDLAVTGSGDIQARGLHARSVLVKVIGSGDITLHARETVDATVTGSGDITVYGGAAAVNRTIQGSGTISEGVESRGEGSPSTRAAQ